MSTVPNSDVYLLKGVPLDKNYDDTFRFNPFDTSGRVNQFSYFLNYRKNTYTALSYLRDGANRIKLNDTYENVYDCNYMIFKNTGHENRYYYAFIDKAEYISESCVTITYTIDVIQTYLYDIKFEPSMIEREHSQTDVMGENDVDEGLSFGDVLVTGKNDSFIYEASGSYPTFKIVVSYVINDGTRKLVDPAQQPTRQSSITPRTWEYQLIDYSQQHESLAYPYRASIVNGIYMGFTYYALDFDIRETTSYSSGGMTLTYKDDTQNKIICLLDQLTDIQATVVNIALIPRAVWDAETSTTYSKSANIAESNFFKKRGKTSNVVEAYQYIPKNKKMFCYPYKRIVISNNAGQVQELKWELCDDASSTQSGTRIVSLTAKGAVLPSPEITVYPTYYRGLELDYENGLTLNDFPAVSWSIDSFKEWWATNRQTFSLSMISTAITGSIGISGTALNSANAVAQSKHPEITGAIGNQRVAGAGFNMIDNMVKSTYPYITAKNTPDQLYGQTSASALRVKMNRIGYTVYDMSIDAESAECIDNYFTMFGYATKKLKLPNLFDSTATLRPYWNYIKTNGANIHPKYGASALNSYGVEADALAQIIAIFDHGIRFWNPSIDIGDYNHDNSPT